MDSIIEFLDARIAEDETQARAALATVAPDEWENPAELGNFYPKDIAFWNRQTPRRVLAECAAKRVMLSGWQRMVVEHRRAFKVDPPLSPVIGAFAAVYKDHPDYQQEWA
ncbi:hypothetical protein PP635_gp40 [Arthrobacter phage Auxilium]|uniref:Uncharacterized protein n=1 Tax=Arthrobacter phage Auxilium TaxID=2419948 RepID=A0A3G2KA74_9CAUD|nr:hypothetical protein PP635_gp40 [Arthrobacter phage Auxilium]AYN55819.1 hypothetical protein PBI_AUXILIUM_40 [Arthrobacter phage Auxilium]